MNFGQALEALKLGSKVAREGWNGKNMYLFIYYPLENATYEGIKILPHIVMKTAGNEILNGWLASQTDMLAEDWVIILD